jgi:sulfate-transporting ATPase
MSFQYAFVLKGLSKTWPGGREVLKDIWLSFLPGAKIGVIGSNGAGKSTLMRIMAGIEKDFQGEAWAADGIQVGYLPQEPGLDPDKTVFGNVLDGAREQQEWLERFEALSARFAEPMDDETMQSLLDEQAALQACIDAAGAWDLERTVTMAMEALRCPPGDSPVTHLSGGEKRRVALCRLLIQKPDVLILDEPTNHLDADSVAWLERYLQQYKGMVVLVTHDRYFLDHVVGWILELDRGQALPFEGNYTQWLEYRQKRLAVEQKQESSRQRQMAQELEWVRQSPKARQAKSKARLKAYEAMVEESIQKTGEVSRIVIPQGPRLGDRVITLSHVTKSFGDRVLVDNLSFSVPPGAIVGIIGPNGAGKTTLFRMLTGQDTPDAGEIVLGESVQLGYVDQSRDTLNPDHTVWQDISGGKEIIDLGRRSVPSRAWCALFNFKGADQQKKIGQLSGGERNRVHLARMLQEKANVLLLDEPTNDLDVDTLRALEEALTEFPGCALITSHDRWFLDRLATHILAFEGDSQVVWFEGNFQDYEADRKRRLGDDFIPSRIRYKASGLGK